MYKINITVSYLKFVRCTFHTAIKLTCSSIFHNWRTRNYFRQLNPCWNVTFSFAFCYSITLPPCKQSIFFRFIYMLCDKRESEKVIKECSALRVIICQFLKNLIDFCSLQEQIQSFSSCQIVNYRHRPRQPFLWNQIKHKLFTEKKVITNRSHATHGRVSSRLHAQSI